MCDCSSHFSDAGGNMVETTEWFGFLILHSAVDLVKTVYSTGKAYLPEVE